MLAAPAAGATKVQRPEKHNPSMVGRYLDDVRGYAAHNHTARRSASTDQCGKPLQERVGGWLCSNGNSSRHAARSPRQGVTAPAAARAFCNSSGCYTRLGDFESYFESSSGTWGYGTTVLGEQSHYVEWLLQGGQNTHKPVEYKNSVHTHEVIFTGDLFAAGPGQIGRAIEGKLSLYNAGSVAANTPARWLPNGYKSYDIDWPCHTVVHQFTWKHGSYPGYWYSWVKSIVNCEDAEDGIYKFGSDSSLPAAPFGGGYRQ
jgi:hypothetical protein